MQLVFFRNNDIRDGKVSGLGVFRVGKLDEIRSTTLDLRAGDGHFNIMLRDMASRQ